MKKSMKIVIFLLGVNLLIACLLGKRTAVGIIGGADGPTQIYIAKKKRVNSFAKYGLLIAVPCGLLMLLIKQKKAGE